MRSNPSIRFDEISGKWKHREFNKVFNILKNNALSRAELSNECGIAKNIHYGDILVKFGDILDTDKAQLPYITDDAIAFEQEYEKFRENPLVDDFLRAELAFCRMMQEVYVLLADEVDFEV